MTDRISAGSPEAIPVGGIKALAVNNRRVLVCRLEDGFYAVADECSHDYAPISTGRLKGDEIECPRHGARFDIRTGHAKAPPAVVGIETYKVTVENGEVFVEVD
ncbi:MAG: non-heme iron oxygenase ferredoxin subunit [Candidatus Zixiibacteriota bacterium]|nr:MAG: non-heme iron oxygenase ferredoxin subunit [candidate division Zixibacteria bacterium]